MRWLTSGWVAAGAAAFACTGPPAPTTAPPAAVSSTPAGRAWLDVAGEARVEKSGTYDAAVIVAVARHATLPPEAEAHVSGEDWARFFRGVLGVPAERVTTLLDGAASPQAISSTVRAASLRIGPQGRLWFVALGHAVVSPAQLTLATAGKGQLISVLDVAHEATAAPSLQPPRTFALAPITFSIAHPTPLPGTSRSALSYLLMGALRGWGDRDHDGRVTAAEAAAYADTALRILVPQATADPIISASSDLVCSELTTLSLAREPAPSGIEFAPLETKLRERDNLLRPTLQSGDPALGKKARSLYERAEQEADPALARCAWSEAANTYAASWRSDSETASQVEAALNGAYAYRKLGRSDEAVALYRDYVAKQAGARSGERESEALSRRAYAFAACASYLAIARVEPRHFPGYFAMCKEVNCTGIDPATCASFSTGSVLPEPPFTAEERARKLGLRARDREELAGWEVTESARLARLQEASAWYAEAEIAWTAIVDAGGTAAGSDEALRQLADTTAKRLFVDLRAGIALSEERFALARQRARRARDASFDERRIAPAKLLIELADAQPASLAAAAAREELIANTSPAFDAAGLRFRVAYEAGRIELRSGHFSQARRLLTLPYTLPCGFEPVAHDAWTSLLEIANLEANVAAARSLALDTSVCAVDVEQRIHADRLRKPVRSIPFALDGRRQLQASESLPVGPERRALRREAAAIFRQFVAESPDRAEAPESARLAADLYGELGEAALALEMYRLFIDRYGSGPGARVIDLELAYTALARLHEQSGDYRASARALYEASERKQLPARARAQAARLARELRADRDGRGL